MPSDTPQQPKTFYVTTPIYYVNGRPHIGHAYTTIVADVLARRHRLLGEQVFFLTGTDEHGQKIERSAAAAGIPPQQFADEVSAEFKQLWDRMGLTYDKFIRTTEPDHKRGVQKLFRELYDRGFIYLSTYTGSYCVSDEAFVDQPAGTPCPDCGRPLETVTEENFFFKLSEFQKPLLDLIESNQLLITPNAARNEVLRFVRGDLAAVVKATMEDTGIVDVRELERIALAKGSLKESGPDDEFYVPRALKDLSISRSSFTWGVPVPEVIQQEAGATQPHVVYVWLDALANYITAIGYGDDSDAAQREFAEFWLDNHDNLHNLHLVGKEITRFHCVYWPAFLLAAGLPTPKQITANGWLLFDNAKMSKSKGNVVRTETILDAFGTLCPPVHLPAATTTSSELDSEGENRESTNGQHTTGENTMGRGMASAVPSEPTKEAALAAEVRPPTPHERDLFASDVLRYFLLREIPFGQDGSFSFDAMVTRYNADLANGYGNLVSRTLTMVERFCSGVIPSAPSLPVPFKLASVRDDDPRLRLQRLDGLAVEVEIWFASEVGLNNFAKALSFVSTYITQLDSSLSLAQPWKLAKSTMTSDRELLLGVLYEQTQALRIITILLHPIMPYSTLKVWKQLGLDEAELTTYNVQPTTQWGGLKPGTKLGPLSPIFPRADKSLAQVMIDMEDSRTRPAPQTASTDPAAAPRSGAVDTPGAPLTVGGSSAEQPTLPTTPGPASTAPASGVFAGQHAPGSQTPAPPADDAQPITIDDFLKIELRVALILVAERIPKADKLLRLEVDLGTETRQILSGIAQWYTPEDLIGRRIVVVSNLAPRKMRGLESHGMLLAASEGPDGKPILATFGEDIALGSRVR